MKSSTVTIFSCSYNLAFTSDLPDSVQFLTTFRILLISIFLYPKMFIDSSSPVLSFASVCASIFSDITLQSPKQKVNGLTGTFADVCRRR